MLYLYIHLANGFISYCAPGYLEYFGRLTVTSVNSLPVPLYSYTMLTVVCLFICEQNKSESYDKKMWTVVLRIAIGTN